MPTGLATKVLAAMLLTFFCHAGCDTPDFDNKTAIGRQKRGVLTFPTDSLLQINMGISLAGKLENNKAAIVLAFQQNAKLPTESESIFLGSQVVTARKFSIYDYLKEVMSRYGFDGVECLKKMICQSAETPLIGGLLEEIITFTLSPSKHRNSNSKEFGTSDLLLESEYLGKNGGNCSFLFPRCKRTPLDVVSSFVYL